MAEIPQHLDQRTHDLVMADMRPSLLMVYFKSGLAIIIGGVISLFVCGQFGFGLTEFATTTNHNIHMSAGGLFCAVFCGGIFALLPPIILRSLSSPIQYQALLFRQWNGPIIWLVVFALLFSFHSGFGDGLLHFIAWLASSIFCFLVTGLIVMKVVDGLELRRVLAK